MKTWLGLILGIALCGGLWAGNAFGTYQIITEPSGAVVTIAGTNQFLGYSPTGVHPIGMYYNVVWNGGIPGNLIYLNIYKEGYIPIQQSIFVPFNQWGHGSAWEYPTVFRFQLRKIPPPPIAYYYPASPNPCPPQGQYFYGVDRPSPNKPHPRPHRKPRRY